MITACAAWCLAALGHAPSPTDTLDLIRSYDAPFVSTSPGIDGDLSDPAWDAAPWSEPFVDIRGSRGPAPQLRTRVKIVWDERHLFVAAELAEPDLWASLVERDAIVYQDNDFEVFLDPDGDGLRYFELEINAFGTEFDLFLDRPYSDGGRAHIDWDMPGLETAVAVQGTLNDPSDRDAGWTVEIAIPWEDLVAPDERTAGAHVPGPPRLGDVWRVNFSRVQWPLRVRGGAYERAELPSERNRHPEDNWVWSPQGEIDMHVPERWGRVRFVGRRAP